MTAEAAHLSVSKPYSHLALFDRLNEELSFLNLEVEFYFVGGAVMFQCFTWRPSTAHVSALFQPVGLARGVIERVGLQTEAGTDWLPGAVRGLLAVGPDRQDFLTLSHLCVFTPLLDYLLAVKCGAMLVGDDFREENDVRYVLRAMNIVSVEAAMSIVTRYFSERQLAPDTRASLERILGG